MSALLIDVSKTTRPSGDVQAMTGDFTVGSLKGDCTVKLDDEYVSNRHARFYEADGGWWVEDLGSTNGTYLLPGYQRRYEPQRLHKGTQVRIGHTILTVVPV